MTKARYLSEQDQDQLTNWWVWLDQHRGDRATLRRAECAEDVLITPAFAHFLQKMPPRWSANNIALPLTDAAMVAAIIARVRSLNSASFGQALATPKEGASKAAMSELRFQQLQKSRSEEDFFRRTCRAVALLGGTANITDLADSILHWLHEFRTGPAAKPGQRLAVRWATEYYAAFKE